MRTFALASGSSGNCFLIEDDNKGKYLVDIGLSFKKITEILKEKDISPQEILGVFITHEHSDHILGLDVFMKNTNCPIYLTKGTFDGLSLSKSNKESKQTRFIFIKENQIMNLENLKVFIIGKSHDANEPVSFVFDSNNKKVGFFTDLGKVTPQIIEILKNLDIIYFETNFCENIVRKIDFNPVYTTRLMSDLGHLSVQDAIFILQKFANKNQKIILSHISENTNSYENAYTVVKNFCLEHNILCDLFVSFQGEPSEWFE